MFVEMQTSPTLVEENKMNQIIRLNPTPLVDAQKYIREDLAQNGQYHTNAGLGCEYARSLPC